MTLSEDHHYISQLILRGFSRDGARLITVTKALASSDSFDCYPRMSIRGRAFEKGFNLVDLPAGKATDVLERAVATHIEGPAGEARAEMLLAPYGVLHLNPRRRRAMCLLAGLLHANSPIGRGSFDPVLDKVFAGLKAAPGAASLVRSMALGAALDNTDTEEVAAWEHVLGLLSAGDTPEARANARRLTLLWGQMTAKGLQRMSLTVLRIDAPPFFVLPDLPVLGHAPDGGDIPDPGSWVIFPIDHRHLVVFTTDSQPDMVRGADSGMLVGLWTKTKGPLPMRIQKDVELQTSLSFTSMHEELYAYDLDDVLAAARLFPKPPSISVKSGPGVRGSGIVLPTGR
ncbi:MAG TPA: DUF4238 domain-containing protein [Candidatus Acidoferrum sp.]|jgi:hypothetical protein|nr:DUF4238 domain-containing protein [Candidatus Acidoferrum sp.]